MLPFVTLIMPELSLPGEHVTLAACTAVTDVITATFCNLQQMCHRAVVYMQHTPAK